jgi:hypothetical protein
MYWINLIVLMMLNLWVLLPQCMSCQNVIWAKEAYVIGYITVNILYTHESKIWWFWNICCVSRLFMPSKLRSQDSSASIATRLRAGQPGFNSQQGQEIFLFSVVSRPTLGPIQPPIQWVPGVLSLGVKWQGCEADHSPPCSVEVKNGGAMPPLPHMPPWHSA